MPLLSVVIITFNEEKNIGRCLESVKGLADDIVVVDSFSTDDTAEICKKYKVNFIQKTWEGYSENKNYGNSLAKNDWILSLDADEALSAELIQSIASLKQSSEAGLFRICRLTNYCGTWIKHSGWYPDKKVRLFDRRSTHWEGSIHEKLCNIKEHAVPVIKGDCYHYSYYSLRDHKAQARRFSEMAAQDLFTKGKSAGWLKIIFSVLFKFVKGYIVKLGFLDGMAGWRIATVSAHAVFLKYLKLRELHAKK